MRIGARLIRFAAKGRGDLPFLNHREAKEGSHLFGTSQMDRIDHAFCALSQRMNSLSAPGRAASAPEPLTNLIAKVDAAKQHYQPGMRR